MNQSEIEKWISTTIKKKYMDKILEGKKTIEYKKASEYWEKRLNKYREYGREDYSDVGINFLCGQKSYKFEVKNVSLWYHTDGLEIDGEMVRHVFHIVLGKRLDTEDNRNQGDDIDE